MPTQVYQCALPTAQALFCEPIQTCLRYISGAARPCKPETSNEKQGKGYSTGGKMSVRGITGRLRTRANVGALCGNVAETPYGPGAAVPYQSRSSPAMQPEYNIFSYWNGVKPDTGYQCTYIGVSEHPSIAAAGLGCEIRAVQTPILQLPMQQGYDGFLAGEGLYYPARIAIIPWQQQGKRPRYLPVQVNLVPSGWPHILLTLCCGAGMLYFDFRVGRHAVCPFWTSQPLSSGALCSNFGYPNPL